MNFAILVILFYLKFLNNVVLLFDSTLFNSPMFETFEKFNSLKKRSVLNISVRHLIENSKGVPVPRGHHSYLALFIKRAKDQNDLLKTEKKDFTSEEFLCSGVILNRRWVLSKAKPISYYPIGSFYMTVQRQIQTPLNPDRLKIYEIDSVAVHPKYEEGCSTYDLALVRTAEFLNFTFDIGSVNINPQSSLLLENCKLIVWSFTIKNNGTSYFILSKSEIPFTVTSKSNCSSNEVLENIDSFYCLEQLGKIQYEPCAINAGAPVMCSYGLAGIYSGYNGNPACTGNSKNSYSALRFDNSETQPWIERALKTEAYDPKALQSEKNKNRYKECGFDHGKCLRAQYWLILITILLLI